MIDNRLIKSIKVHEGYRSRAYQDTEGVWTIGYGTNLQTLQIKQDLAERWMVDKIVECYQQAIELPEWEFLDTMARRNVVVEMIYNLGLAGYKKFKRARLAMQNQDWKLASMEMLDSKWADQVGVRADNLAGIMRNGFYE